MNVFLRSSLMGISNQIRNIVNKKYIKRIAWMLDQTLRLSSHGPDKEGAESGENIFQLQKNLVYILGHLVNDAVISENIPLPYYLETFAGKQAL